MPAFILSDLIHSIKARLRTLNEIDINGDAGDENQETVVRASAPAPASGSGNPRPTGTDRNTMWNHIFDPARQEDMRRGYFVDEDDGGIARCRNCGTEVFHGQCQGCMMVFSDYEPELDGSSDGEPFDAMFSGSVGSDDEDDMGSDMDDFIDDAPVGSALRNRRIGQDPAQSRADRRLLERARRHRNDRPRHGSSPTFDHDNRYEPPPPPPHPPFYSRTAAGPYHPPGGPQYGAVHPGLNPTGDTLGPLYPSSTRAGRGVEQAGPSGQSGHAG
jgi:hypothetical protein